MNMSDEYMLSEFSEPEIYRWLQENFNLTNFSALPSHMISQIKRPQPYYGDQLYRFRNCYSEVHGYLSLIVCTFGIIANILNIIVLTRKHMISPTNAILTGLAVADMFVMMSYMPFAFHNYILINQPDHVKFSYHWAVYALFHAHFSVVCHTISIWLTVILAVWRFLAVSFPANSKSWCNMPRAKIAIISTYVNCAIFCLPVYLTFTINSKEDGSHVLYKVDFSSIAKKNDGLLEKFNFWIFSVLTKLIPCIALTGLSIGLIRVLYEANRRKQKLKNRIESENACDRTTKMLLAVLLLFLITEFPSGILALLNGILGQDFFDHVYNNFGEVIDILALINSSVNFILYCSMSRQFRETFANLFTPKLVSKWIAVPTDSNTCATTCV